MAWIQDSNPWLWSPLSVPAIFLAMLGGQALGGLVRRRAGADGGQLVAPLQTALIGLLSLMIAFTFSQAAARYDARKAAVLNEANAISTAQERAVLLPAPHAANATGLLNAYLDDRIAMGAVGLSPAEEKRLNARSRSVQDSLRQVAKQAAADNPGSQPGGLFIVALNDMGDRQEQRLAALNNQVPRAVFLMLHGLAIVA